MGLREWGGGVRSKVVGATGAAAAAPHFAALGAFLFGSELASTFHPTGVAEGFGAEWAFSPLGGLGGSAF